MASLNSDWMTIAEASAYLRVGRATLYRWAREGRLRLHKIGARTTRVRRQELDQMRNDDAPANGWAALSEASFAADWESNEDAIYDDWRSAYGVSAR
jgi:excisionase family DNA binding protein